MGADVAGGCSVVVLLLSMMNDNDDRFKMKIQE